MDESHKEWRANRHQTGVDIDQQYAELRLSLDQPVLPAGIVDQAKSLATTIDSHLHDLAASKQEDSSTFKHREQALSHLLNATEPHLDGHLRAIFERRQAAEEHRAAHQDQAQDRKARSEQRWELIKSQPMTDKAGARTRIGGTPTEVFDPKPGLKSNGTRELRFYADGFELDLKRPKRIHAAAWLDIESVSVASYRGQSLVKVRLHDGVPVTMFERFQRRTDQGHILIPDLFDSTPLQLASKINQHIRES